MRHPKTASRRSERELTREHATNELESVRFARVQRWVAIPDERRLARFGRAATRDDQVCPSDVTHLALRSGEEGEQIRARRAARSRANAGSDTAGTCLEAGHTRRNWIGESIARSRKPARDVVGNRE